jgi:hypothetical protein
MAACLQIVQCSSTKPQAHRSISAKPLGCGGCLGPGIDPCHAACVSAMGGGWGLALAQYLDHETRAVCAR